MKKTLLTTAVAAVALMVTSCSRDVETYTLEQVRSAQYENAFAKHFGTINKNQDWGFDESKSAARTRSASTNSNQWFDGQTEQFKHLVKPADVTAREEQVVSEWFKTHKNPTSDEIYLTEFFVQQVYFGTKEYHSTDNNGNPTSVVGGQHMDWLYAWDPVGYTDWQGNTEHKDHINNFNTSSPQRTDPDNSDGFHNMQLMQNSSTEVFGFHESYNTQNDRYYPNFVLKAIEVDGVVGYYVGFDYESHGDRGDFNPDGFYDDRIVKIVPGDGVYENIDPVKTSGRIFCEDLGSIGDFDFNDVVFDAYIYESGKINITVLAAGGILPISVAGQDVHELLLTKDMVNTGLKNVDTQSFTVSAEVAAENGWTTLKSIPVIVSQTDEAGQTVDILLKAEIGKAPQKICVPVGTPWANEYVSIEKAYPLFKDWVKKQITVEELVASPVTTFVYLLDNNK